MYTLLTAQEEHATLPPIARFFLGSGSEGTAGLVFNTLLESPS